MASVTKSVVGKEAVMARFATALKSKIPLRKNLYEDAGFASCVIPFIKESCWKKNFVEETKEDSYLVKVSKVKVTDMAWEPYFNNSLVFEESRKYPKGANAQTPIYVSSDLNLTFLQMKEAILFSLNSIKNDLSSNVIKHLCESFHSAGSSALVINRLVNYSPKVAVNVREHDLAKEAKIHSAKRQKISKSVTHEQVQREINNMDTICTTKRREVYLPSVVKGQNLGAGLRSPHDFFGNLPGFGPAIPLLNYVTMESVQKQSETKKREGLKRSLESNYPLTMRTLKAEGCSFKDPESVIKTAARTIPLEKYGHETTYVPPWFVYDRVDDPLYVRGLLEYLKTADCSLKNVSGSNFVGRYYAQLFFAGLIGENMDFINHCFGSEMPRMVDVILNRETPYPDIKLWPLTVYWRNDKEGQKSGFGNVMPRNTEETEEKFASEFEAWLDPQKRMELARVEAEQKTVNQLYIRIEDWGITQSGPIRSDVFFMSYTQSEKNAATMPREDKGTKPVETDAIYRVLIPSNDHLRTVGQVLLNMADAIQNKSQAAYKTHPNNACAIAFLRKFVGVGTCEEELKFLNKQRIRMGTGVDWVKDNIRNLLTNYDALLDAAPKFPTEPLDTSLPYEAAWFTAFGINGQVNHSSEAEIKVAFPNFRANQLFKYPEKYHLKLCDSLADHRYARARANEAARGKRKRT